MFKIERSDWAIRPPGPGTIVWMCLELFAWHGNENKPPDTLCGSKWWLLQASPANCAIKLDVAKHVIIRSARCAYAYMLKPRQKCAGKRDTVYLFYTRVFIISGDHQQRIQYTHRQFFPGRIKQSPKQMSGTLIPLRNHEIAKSFQLFFLQKCLLFLRER